MVIYVVLISKNHGSTNYVISFLGYWEVFPLDTHTQIIFTFLQVVEYIASYTRVKIKIAVLPRQRT